MSDIQYIDGLIAKAPNSGAPEYVKAKLSIHRERLIAWLQQQEGEWINAEMKESKGGKWYIAVDAWKPNSERQESPAPRQRQAPAQHADASNGDPFGDEIPFRSIPFRSYL